MSCRGSGIVEGTKTAELVIPGGVESEATITIVGAGNVSSRTSQPGNLYIKLKVANDSTFTRDGSDIYVDANISFTQVSTLVNPEFWVISRAVPSKLMFFLHGDTLWSKLKSLNC
jgi:DnaJ-class molecular chaperone